MDKRALSERGICTTFITPAVKAAAWDVHETGFFGNTNTICKPTATKWRTTVERLKLKFREFDKA